MPWVVRQDKGFSPISISTAKPYRGVNTVVLWAQAQNKGYSSALWGTYQNWQSIGGQVRKGERGSPVVYWGTFETDSKQPGNDEKEVAQTRLFARRYTVFNLEQVDGVKLPKRFEPKLSVNERIGRAETFLKVLKADKRAIFTAASKAQQAADYLIAGAGNRAASELAA
jgi:antirestriction protein ArdC